MELKIYMRQTQNFAIDNPTNSGINMFDPIIYVGSNPYNITPVSGIVPKPNYKDFTKSVSGLDKLSITWTTERDNNGIVVEGALMPNKTATGQITMEGDAYFFIKEWLRDSVSATLNAVDVRIEHVGCGFYDGLIIKPHQITWCDNDICEISLTLQQKDEAMDCIRKTLISDNWQQWFPQDGKLVNKKHPRFLYCDEIRPIGLTVMLFGISGLIQMVLYTLTPLINTVIAIIGFINTIIDALSWLFGGSPNWDNFNFFDPAAIFKSYYLEGTGCGYMHPAPFIRDYIDNVCRKCGVNVDATSDPIFHAEKINIDISSERNLGIKERDNPYFHATYMAAELKEGIRILRGKFVNFNKDSNRNTTDYWIDDNRPLLTLDMFLDTIKGVFNAEWRVADVNGTPTLFFWRKDWFLNGKKIYNFAHGADRDKIIAGVCFTASQKKTFAYIRGLYGADSDSCGVRAQALMNDLVSMGDFTNNSNFEGEMTKTVRGISATKFRLDGHGSDYVMDIVQQLLNANMLIPGVMAGITNQITNALKVFGDYTLLLSQDTFTNGKIIVWDKTSGLDFARAIRDKSCQEPVNTGSNLPLPTINPFYNVENKTWYQSHHVDAHISGEALSSGPDYADVGRYRAADALNLVSYSRAGELCNWPMYFQAGFKNNIFDWFHWVDDVRIAPANNMEWELKIDLCCEDLNKLKVFGDGHGIALGEKVSLSDQYYDTGIITSITASYDPEDLDGMYIEIKGRA